MQLYVEWHLLQWWQGWMWRDGKLTDAVRERWRIVRVRPHGCPRAGNCAVIRTIEASAPRKLVDPRLWGWLIYLG